MLERITIIGNGGWGTTLAVYLANRRFRVTLWGDFPDEMREIHKTRVNRKFLPGIKIPSTVIIADDLAMSVNTAQLIILATPSQYTLGILKRLKPFDFSRKIILSVIKGIECRSLKRMSELIYQELGKIKLAVLSGPTIAMEIARGLPATAVVAAQDALIARKLQSVLNSDSFRIYTNSDLIGVELGGSIKNIIAVACGVCDGLGFGSNAKSAILTRGLAEMTRLGAVLGAKTQTFSGLTGLGDLVTTCFSPQSRNRSVGESLGKGVPIEKIISKMDMVAEGIETVKSVYRLSRQHKVLMPISTEVYNIVYKKKNPKQAVDHLMCRQVKSEMSD